MMMRCWFSATMKNDQLVPSPPTKRGLDLSFSWRGTTKKERLRSECGYQKALPTAQIKVRPASQCVSGKPKEFYQSTYGSFLERALVRVAPRERLTPSRTLKFRLADGQGAVPKPTEPLLVCQSKRASSQQQQSRWDVDHWSQDVYNFVSLLFGDILGVDMMTTRTMSSLPRNQINTDNPLGEKNSGYDMHYSCRCMAPVRGRHRVSCFVDRQKVIPLAMGQLENCPCHCLSIDLGKDVENYLKGVGWAKKI